jgi:hypothetical protein
MKMKSSAAPGSLTPNINQVAGFHIYDELLSTKKESMSDYLTLDR